MRILDTAELATSLPYVLVNHLHVRVKKRVFYFYRQILIQMFEVVRRKAQ